MYAPWISIYIGVVYLGSNLQWLLAIKMSYCCCISLRLEVGFLLLSSEGCCCLPHSTLHIGWSPNLKSWLALLGDANPISGVLHKAL